MEKRKQARETVESLSECIELIRKLISLIFIIKVGAIMGILNYKFIISKTTHRPFFELPSQFIYELSSVGFSISGLFIGMGNKLSEGGLISHVSYGITRFSLPSLMFIMIVFLISCGAFKLKQNYLSFLVQTNNLFLRKLDKSIFLNFGSISICFCILIVSIFFYLVKTNQLSKKMMIKRGIFLF
jgi:hypothetical protein